MSKIRNSRINKFKKQNWKAVIVMKIISIWILFSFSLMFLTGNTAAYFNHHSAVTGIFTAGFWEEIIENWDKSSLKFIDPKKEVTITSCGPTVISTTIKNNDNDMQGTSEFYVFFSIKDNPMKGEEIYEGVVNPIKKNHTEVLEYQTSIAGNYKFKALQRPGHGNKYDSRHELWSETIIVECKENGSTESINEEEESTPDAEEEVIQNVNNEKESESKESNNEENVEEDNSVESDVKNSGDNSTEEVEHNQKDQSDAEVKTEDVETTEEPETQEKDENTSSEEET